MNVPAANRNDGGISGSVSSPNETNAGSSSTPLDPPMVGPAPVDALPSGPDAGLADAGASPPPLDPCAGALRFGDSCYRASSTALPWTEARADCLSTGADLVKIESAEEDELVGELLDVSIWVGARDPVQNVFTWTDGSATLFTNWGNGQPNAGPEQPNVDPGPDCVEKRQEPGDERWYDLPCGDPNFYVCESDAVP